MPGVEQTDPAQRLARVDNDKGSTALQDIVDDGFDDAPGLSQFLCARKKE